MNHHSKDVLPEQELPPPLTSVGVVLGSLFVGNLGTASFRVPAAIGEPAERAALLAHLAAHLPCDVVMDKYAAKQIGNRSQDRPVDVVTGGCFGHRHVVSELLSIGTDEETPWLFMADLKGSDKGSDNSIQEAIQLQKEADAFYKDGFGNLLQGDLLAAEECFVRYRQTVPDDRVTTRLLTIIAKKLEIKDDSLYCRNVDTLPFEVFQWDALVTDQVDLQF